MLKLRSRKTTQTEARFPSIDGMRAVAVFWVVLCHLSLTDYGSAQVRALHSFLGSGWLGVDIFFVLSGFLITRLLIREQKSTSTIDLVQFYRRRAVRILPAFLIFWLVVLALGVWGWISISDHALTSALFFWSNYDLANVDWPLTHTWSLSIEEQFYLLWPFALYKLGPRRSLGLAVILFGASPILRAWLISQGAQHTIGFGSTTHTHADMIMAGCILALLWQKPTFVRFCEGAYRLHLPELAILYLFGFSQWAGHAWDGRFNYWFGFTINSLAIALVLTWVIERPRSWAGRFLNSTPLVHLGLLSYSLYLWQQLFTHPFVDHWWSRLPGNLFLILVAAELSRRWIERPMLVRYSRLKALTDRVNTGDKNNAKTTLRRKLPNRAPRKKSKTPREAA